MYYMDLVAAAETDITCRYYRSLVDAGHKHYEISNCHTETKSKSKTLSAEEEERDKRIFQLFRRKKRSSVTVPPDDDSGMDYPQNPNSSTSSLLPNPRNPNSQEKKTSRKRRAAQEKRPCVKFKKEEADDTYSWIGRETPESLVQLMNETVIRRGERTDLKLIFERKLFQTDVKPQEGRLSMPFNKLILNDFLTPVESTVIEEDINNDKKTGIGAVLFDQRNVSWGVMLKRWEMQGTWNYALTCGWNDIVKSNGLKLGDDISIWSFRWDGVLCFALVTPPPSFHGAE